MSKLKYTRLSQFQPSPSHSLPNILLPSSLLGISKWKNSTTLLYDQQGINCTPLPQADLTKYDYGDP